MKTIAIILNGKGLQKERLQRALNETDIIIAADGGANYCAQNGITPQYIIGDMDSIRINHEQILPDSELIQIDDQYSTDLEKATKLAETLHGDRWLILNAAGKRTDHTLANILFLSHKRAQIDLEIMDDFGLMRFLLPGENRCDLPVGQTVSLLSFQPVKNLTLTGFQYPLTRAKFDSYFVGISNVVQTSPCRIAFSSGLLMMYQVEADL